MHKENFKIIHYEVLNVLAKCGEHYSEAAMEFGKQRNRRQKNCAQVLALSPAISVSLAKPCHLPDSVSSPREWGEQCQFPPRNANSECVNHGEHTPGLFPAVGICLAVLMTKCKVVRTLEAGRLRQESPLWQDPHPEVKLQQMLW